MKENIRFRGLTLYRDEQAVDHGEMSLCGGVELHDGALRVSVLDGTKLADGDTIDPSEYGSLVYVHHTAMYTNYILAAYYDNGTAWLWYSYETYDDVNHRKEWQYPLHLMSLNVAVYDSAGHQLYDYRVSGVTYDAYTDGTNWYHSHDYSLDPDALLPPYDPGYAPSAQSKVDKVRSVKSVGNTLIVMRDSGIYYALAEITTGYAVEPTIVRYKNLGRKPPFLELQFNLKKAVLDSTYKKYVLPWSTHSTSIYVEFDDSPKLWIKDEYIGEVTDAVLANINYVTDQIAGAGCFYGPFLIRYAYRLYDGTSLIMHSPPVLMIPMLKHPIRTWASVNGWMFVYAMMCDLQVKLLSSSSIVNKLKDWSDIVKSVDIFITPQHSRIRTDESVQSITVFDPDSVSDKYLSDDKSLIDGAFVDIVSEYKTLYVRSTDPLPNQQRRVDLPEYEEKEYLSSVTNASAFFKLTSVNIDDLNTVFTSNFTNLKFDSYILRNITTQQQMTDDYKTHNLLLPATEEAGGMFVYNNRLNVYGISEQLFKGFSPSVLFPYSASGLTVSEVDTWINTDHGLRRVKNTGSWTVLQWLLENGYCFYPDSRAARIGFFTTVFKYRRMDDCNELNGAFSFLPESATSSTLPTSIADDIVPLLNKIYTSRADNPFYFPNLPGESGINSVGTGEIIGAAAVTRALSTGSSVGDHDLAVFSSDGIWVGKVSATGTYSNFHNISREVCINRDSICQLDQSVLFATDRSLSRFVEQNAVSITDVLDGPWFDVETRLASLKTYLTQQSLADALRLVAFDTAPDVYYREGKVFYDYLSSRIIVFRKDLSSASIALVFSMRDQAWSTMDVPPLKAVLNSYPTPYIQDASGVVTRLDKPYDHESSTLHNGVIVTRTLTYSDSMDLIRGFRQLTDASHMPLLFFYGSNDQRTWQEIGRSSRAFHNYMPGHPFRFFRVAIVMQMLTAERYQQLELEIINKYAKL